MNTQTQKGDDSMRAEEETGGLLPQVKEWLGLPEAGGGKERPSPRCFGGSRVLPKPRFRASSLQNCEKVNFSSLEPQAMVLGCNTRGKLAQRFWLAFTGTESSLRV